MNSNKKIVTVKKSLPIFTRNKPLNNIFINKFYLQPDANRKYYED